MSGDMAIVAVVALSAVILLAFVLTHRQAGKVNMKLSFGAQVDLEGDNAALTCPGRIVGEDPEAERNLTAVGKTGGDVEVREAKAGGDLTLGTENPGSAGDRMG